MSTSLAIIEMQIQISLRFHFPSVAMSPSRKQIAEAGKGVRKQNTHSVLVGMQTGTAIREISVEVSQ